MTRITLITLILALFQCLPSVAAHEEFVLDSRRATPGPRLELIPLPLDNNAAPRSKYRLEVEAGLPRDVLFRVLTKDFSHGFHTVGSGFQLDDSGHLVSTETRKPVRLNEMIFEPGPYPRGAAWEIALISADRNIRLFAKTIPYPILGHDGPCTISLELLSQRGDRFLALGSGFIPGDEVITESRYSGRVVQKRKEVSSAELFTLDAIAHGSRGLGGIARYTVTGQACNVVVDYEWGEPALIRR
jgi:hypothetical protein